MQREIHSLTHECFPRYEGSATVDNRYYDGRLLPVRGVHHYQVVRACRNDPNRHWTFNHSPLLAYWNHEFLLQYITCPIDENRPPSQCMLTRSSDGSNWTEPIVLFPPYPIPTGVYRDEDGNDIAPDSFAMMHQRMGFFTSSQGRMICSGFYGISPNPEVMPNDGKGIGRVVRELYRDSTLGPIYFIRYNTHAGWNETNTLYPLYATSTDRGFVRACQELLGDRLTTLSWWEEDRSTDGMYKLENCKAPSYYRLHNGCIVAYGKWSQVAVSDDHGMTWMGPRKEPSITMAGSKIWAQRMKNGKYIIAYNPSPINEERWPLAITQSDDGIVFDDLLLLCGEVPVQRYAGMHKFRGINYISGITEGNGDPPGDYIWLTYSMNKEDIWVCKVPMNIAANEPHPLRFHIGSSSGSDELSDWQLYRPIWSSLAVVALPNEHNRSLMMSNADPYDQAIAERNFPACAKMQIIMRLMAGQHTYGNLDIYVMDGPGSSPCKLCFTQDGDCIAHHAKGVSLLMKYEADQWYDIVLSIDLTVGLYGIAVKNEQSLEGLGLLTDANSVERVRFRVGGGIGNGPWNGAASGENVPNDCKDQCYSYFLHSLSVVPNNG